MALSVSTQGNSGNPYLDEVGKALSNAVVLSSGEVTGPVVYEVRRRDRQGGVLKVRSSTTATELVKSCTVAALTIVLPFRTKHEFRVQSATGVWSEWFRFKTRDKKYSSPDANTQLTVEEEKTRTGKRILVANSAKATVTKTTTGAIVRCSDQQWNEGVSQRKTSTGYRIVNKTGIVRAAHGVKFAQL